jgi:hypothetical protein
MQDNLGSTPLHWACRYGHAPIVHVLLDSKADPDKQNSLDDTPMHEAAVLGKADPLHWLVRAGANPTLRNRENNTPADVAARSQASDAEALLRSNEQRRRWRKAGSAAQMEQVSEGVEPAVLPLAPPAADRRSGVCAVDDTDRGVAPASVSHTRLSSKRSPADIISAVSTVTRPPPLQLRSPSEQMTLAGEFPSRAFGPERPERPGKYPAVACPAKKQLDQSGDSSGSDSDADVPEEPSLALVVVRAARPLLRGVQWLANRMLGAKTPQSSAANNFEYDSRSDSWVLHAQHDERVASDIDDSDSSGASGSDDDDCPTPPVPAARRQPRRARCEAVPEYGRRRMWTGAADTECLAGP